MNASLVAALVLLALATACTTTKSAGFAQRTAPVIRSVYFSGNENVDDDELLSGISSLPRDRTLLFWKTQYRYDASELELDVRRIEAHYRAQGYFSTKVTGKVVPVSKDVVDIRIEIKEGQPSFVTSIQLDGKPEAEGISKEDVLEALGLEKSTIFVHEEYVAGRDKVKQLYLSRGYLFAEVKGQIGLDRDRRTAVVYLAIDPGPLTYFGKTTVSGMTTVPAASVSGRIAWQDGERYDPELVRLTEGRLYALGRFSAVRIDFDRNKKQRVVDMVVRVSESTRHEIRLGGGVGIDPEHYEIRGRAGYVQRGFIWPMTSLIIDLRPAYLFQLADTGSRGFGGEARTALEFEDFLWSRLRLTTEVAYQYSVVEGYTIFGPRTRVGVDRAFLLDRLILAAGWQFRYQSFTDVSSAYKVVDADGMATNMLDEDAAEVGLEDPYRLAYYDQSVSYDLRDDPLDPRLGAFFALRLEEGGTAAGGAFDYLKAVPDVRGYVPVGSRVVLAARLQLGLAADYGDVVPLTQRFFSGGSTSQRGFAQQHLSPTRDDKDGDPVPIGGEAQFETGFEVRVDVKELAGQMLGLVAFVDGADVTEQAEDLFSRNLHWATGLGVRFKTIAGAIRFDVGYRLNRKGEDDPYPDDSFAFHLTIGEAF